MHKKQKLLPKKIKLEKKPIIKEAPKKEKPPVEIKPKGKRGRTRNPELKKTPKPHTSLTNLNNSNNGKQQHLPQVTTRI